MDSHAVRDDHPRLFLAGPDMGVRDDPACIVEGPWLDDDGVGSPFRLTIDLNPAFPTYRYQHRASAVSRIVDDFWLPLRDLERAFV